jgi:hypothetical protein
MAQPRVNAIPVTLWNNRSWLDGTLPLRTVIGQM